ncbi:30S ribosomal protein S6 [Propionibacterium australiense]|uniref:Small ribosomal subunit protein bS6 n=1 Tax=Propionibacterium australiense TaxID=119981 RepID=A0A383S5D6_9ACTN|nr:30S ribosomal protein S6 [Propionibacterium australiense]RLP08146.1 30S ribosomal protein S6 [Propionibacterium australiense]RLP08325.1 30S ribosomal protein S6 [Propionibacterium australiense]SYZ33053.1 30S ribosomal protein S6 [rpsF] [Propionibacterium australiense]VEH89027.1 30S ribosomal protein S6 [Propionibacterium australiense]
MRKYEIMAIISPDVDDRQLQPIVDKYGQRLVAEGATVDEVDIWGRRHLAYPIDKKTEGHYVVCTVTAEPAAVAEIDRLMSIDEQILRTKVLRIDV